MTFQARFAENLLRLRKRAGLTQEDLAIRASLSRDAIRKYERQVNVPALDVLVRLAGALSVPPADLFDGIAYRPGFVGMGKGRYQIADPDSDTALATHMDSPAAISRWWFSTADPPPPTSP